MRIAQITKIKNYRIFRDFVWPPSNPPPFARFNLIYGWNGSGKTAMSSLLANLQYKLNVDIAEGDVEFEFELDGNQHKVPGSSISSSTVPLVKVFNRDFVANTVMAIVSGEADPILFIGQESIEQRQRVDKLRKDLAKAIDDKLAAERKEADSKRDLDDFATDKAKLIKDSLIGSLQHANYNRNNFKRTVNFLVNANPAPSSLSDEERRGLNQQRFLKPKQIISAKLTINCDLTGIHQEVSELANQTIVSQIIDELRNDTDLSNWVQHGLELHPYSSGGATCKFCKNPLSKERRKELEGHFNDELKAFQQKVNQTMTKIDTYIKELNDLDIPDQARFYENLGNDVAKCSDQIRRACNSIVSILQRLKEIILVKRATPFSVMTVFKLTTDDTEAENRLRQAFKKLSLIINEHNEITNNLDKKIQDACKKLEKDFVLQALPDWRKLDADLKTAEQKQTAIAQDLENIQQQIEKIEEQIVERRQPAEELTHELKTYLGHDELQFELKGTGYGLIRGGQPASHLSEGERTAIAFLYFLKSLEDKDFDKEEAIVVIDDPVSSLDANSLYSSFAYMKEKTESCGQLIILTHNFAFFRQVKGWFRSLNSRKETPQKPAHFYMLDTPVTNGQRTAKLVRLDPLLEKFESEYHFLFKKVYGLANTSDSNTSLENFYPFPNIARRLLETFLSYRFPDVSGSFSQQMEKCQFGDEIKTRILRFLNAYSHSGGITDPEHDPSVLSETQSILRDVLELIKKTDGEHYNGLVRMVESSQVNNDLHYKR